MINFNKVEFETSFGRANQLFPSDRMELVFAGRSNVGKSSLLNKIFNRKSLARVSAVPGKTATINFYKVENLRFVDLPGYGYAKVAKGEKKRWNELIGGYFSQEREIGLVFLLIDMRHPPSNDDLTMLESLIDAELPFVVVLTKADKLSKTRREARMQGFQQELPCADQLTLIPFSSETGEGVEVIHAIIDDLAEEPAGEEEEYG